MSLMYAGCSLSLLTLKKITEISKLLHLSAVYTAKIVKMSDMMRYNTSKINQYETI